MLSTLTWGFLRPQIFYPLPLRSGPTRLRVVPRMNERTYSIHWASFSFSQNCTCLYWFNPCSGSLPAGASGSERPLTMPSSSRCRGRDYATHLLELVRLLKGSDRRWLPALPWPPARSGKEVIAIVDSTMNRERSRVEGSAVMIAHFACGSARRHAPDSEASGSHSSAPYGLGECLRYPRRLYRGKPRRK